MKWILALLALLLSGAGLADPQTDPEIRRVEAQLQHVQQEQQSLFQQFQMIQELRRTELQAENPQVIQNSTDYSMPNPPPNYDDQVREKTKREYRIKQYTDDLNRVYARYSDLDAQRKLLLDRLNELTLQR